MSNKTYGNLSLIVLMLNTAFGAFFGHELLFLILSVVFTFFIRAFWGRKTYRVPANCISLLVFQNILIGVFAHLSGNYSASLSYLTQIPAAYIVVNGFVDGFFLTKRKIKNFGIVILLFLALSFFASSSNITGKAVYFRNYSLCVFIAFICVYNFNNKFQARRFLNFGVKISVFVLIFGLVTYSNNFALWEALGIKEVYLAKKDEILNNTFNNRFYTNIFNITFFRMGTVYYEPVNAGYFFDFAILCTFVKRFKTKVLKLVVLVSMCVGLVLTFGKGALLLGGFIFLCFILINLNTVLSNSITFKNASLSTIVMLFLSFLFVNWYFSHYLGTAQPHLQGIIETIKSIINEPVGHGLGSGGNFGNVLDLSKGAETGFFGMVYQMGVIFGLIFVAFFFYLSSFNFSKNRYYFVLSLIPAAILFTSIFQENTFTPQCLFPILSLSFVAPCLCQKKKVLYKRIEAKKISIYESKEVIK